MCQKNLCVVDLPNSKNEQTPSPRFWVLEDPQKWGFTKFNVDEIENLVAEKQVVPESCGVEHVPNPSPLDKWWAQRS